ncbi:hypothetical protein Tco_0063230 [Tanacetum coccineum]
MLPQFRVLSYVCTILAFDPTKSPHYKVVQVGCIVDHDRGYSIHIYSSQTGNWVAYDHSFSSYMFHDRFHQGIYWNNAIHWLQGTMHYRLDIADDPVITKIKLPDSVIVKYGDRQLFGTWATISTTVWSIFLGEREEDSYIVFNLSSGKVVEFKFLNKTLRKLYDLGSPTNYLPYDLYPFRMHQFIALSASI